MNVEERYGAQGHVTGSVIAPHFFVTSALPMPIHDAGNGARSHLGAKIDPLAGAEPLVGKDVAELVIRHSNPRAATPAFEPGQRGAGQGIWQYTGHRSYTAKSIASINFDTLTPNPPKVPPFKMGTQTIAQTIEFNGNADAWTSTATVQFADSTGAPYSPSPVPPCITAVAQRFN